MAELEKGERKRGVGSWRGDLYGRGSVLAEKRRKRGWVDGREVELVGEVSDEGVRGLVEWRGGEGGSEVWSGRLPWDELSEYDG